MAQGSLRWAAAALIVAVGACTEPAKPPPAPPPPPPAPAPAPPPVVAPPQAHDSCGADRLQYLIGHPHTDIPVPVNPNLRRVVCSSCVVTQDYNAARMTIVFDTQSGLVRSVKCW